MAKLRSPNCPTIPLTEALQKARRIYDTEHTHAADKKVLAEDLGYSGISGASASTMGALRQYGLLERAGEGLKISDDAVSVFELPEGAPERIDALRRLAFKPALFQELRTQFNDRLPGDANLRHMLIKRGFLPRTADEVAKVYKENSQLVGDAPAEYNEAEGQPMRASTATAEKSIDSSTSARLTQSGLPAGTPGTAVLPNLRIPVGSEIPVSRDCVMGVTATGKVTQEGIDKLIAYLYLIKPSFPLESEVRQ